jgi:hypothetical protein
MRLRTTAGGYAGQIRDYSPVAGMAALRSGTAARLEDLQSAAVIPPARDTRPPDGRRATPRAAARTTAASR